MMNKDIVELLGKVKSQVKQSHMDIMSKLPFEERAKAQSIIDEKIKEINQEHGDNHFIKDFIQEIYNR